MAQWVRRYLDRLGLELEAPTLAYLTRIVGAHLATLPFENITKFHYLRRHAETGWFLPPIEVHVANMFSLHAGGTCFTANSSFHQLLAALGFELHYVAAMPVMHMGSVVSLPEGRFYVDVGGGGPLFEPVDLSRGCRQERFGLGTHLLPVEGRSGQFTFDHIVEGQLKNHWELDTNRTLVFADFAEAVTKANEPGALFLTFLRCQLYQPGRGRALSLVDNTLTCRYEDGTATKQRLISIEAIESVLAEEFGLPNLPVREAVQTLESLGVDIFAPKE